MNKDHQSERDEVEKKKKELSAKIETMIQEHKEERETVENDAWEEIDKLKEKNKEELAK